MKPLNIDPNDIRERNLRQVLATIHERGAISRVDIARHTRLSRATVTNIVNELLPTGLVRESGRVNSGVGRRPVLLEFQYNSRAVLGIDMGATHITVLALNLGGETMAVRREKFPVLDNPGPTVARMEQLLEEVRVEGGYRPEQVLGVGVAVPAPLEGEQLDRLSPTILPTWVSVDLRRELAHRSGFPVLLDNDANLGVLAEKWWGHGRNVTNLAFVKVGTGVGCGLIIDNTIYRGEGGTAGEIGHTCIMSDGPRCRCGLQGCLEALTSTPFILRTVREIIETGRKSILPVNDLTVEKVVSATRNGDPVAVEVIEQAGHHLGIAIANLLNLVNPGLIVLGGDLTQAGEHLLAPLRRTVRERSFAKSNAEAVITTSRLGEDTVAIGAATLVIQNLLYASETPILRALSPSEGG